MKTNIQFFILALLGAVILSACNYTEEKEEKATTRMETTVETANSLKATSGYQIGDQIPYELVCMVNNAYMGEPQIPIPVDDKTYYGCCDMCVKKLTTEDEARMVIDPFSGNVIDKSQAYIVLRDHKGNVTYYESKKNYLEHREKA
ncbi:hypothetical protein [Zunongwangia sp. H14]|uniref:hypothetical protein n=1 Tax=Zunongwangia sp. H14 TaxID=3240792 RepID=UPI003561C628